MPRRKITFYENSHYHIFNRGIESLQLFRDDADYQAFLDSLSYYLVPFTEKPKAILARTGLAFNATFQARIQLFAYALQPDSFHLLIHQTDHNAIVKFMQRVGTAYSMYFNKKYSRKGTLFEGRFRTKHIDTNDYLLESSKFIHRLGLGQEASPTPPADSTPLDEPGTTPPDQPSESEDPNIQHTSPDIQKSPLSILRSHLSAAGQSIHIPPAPTISKIVTSYNRYNNLQQPGQPLPYIDQAIKPETVLNHLYASKPGMSYKDYIENSDNVEWYKNLTDWLQ